MTFRFTSGAQWFERTTFNFNFSGENMKQLKLTMMATILTLALSFSAFAGDIYGGFVEVPPQTASATTTSSTTTASSQSMTVNPLTQIILVLLNLLPKI
jgi:hypothetical protein